MLALPLLFWAALVVMVVALLLCCIALLSPLLRSIAAMPRIARRPTGRRAAGAHRQGAAE
ncbi:hypothetical protein [Cupriavidus sp. AU9028]|uniref:hypothetical protein n=1 Tax=Cupriavidus sp. AU9028 TaxID=2871157 RepID=UPI001C9407CE|nr:hypothetical protein [Cupriavidus sp. AU9028]MBY4897876.1 hypothetical protein [Cupriavidus sp. AU9028]